MELHPVTQILNFCLTEKETIASNAITNTIKGDFKFNSEEIGILSVQLYNNNMVSKMIPKTRFTVKFDAKSLEEILKNDKTSQNVLYILLSCVSWIINVENTRNISNFDLILNLLYSFPDTIGENTVLSLYKLTNYFFECILKLNQDYSYRDIEYQTMRFLNRYKETYQNELINDTLIKWLKIGYSFENQTSFTQSILSSTGIFAQENSSLFPESIFKEICDIIKHNLSIFNSFELCFLIRYVNLFPPNILLNNLYFLIESILPYLKLKNAIQYNIFDKDKYSTSITSNTIPNLSQYVSVFPQFSSFKYAFQDEIYIFPYFEVDSSFSFSDSIFKIIKKIFQIFENGKIFQYEEFNFDHLNVLFGNILNECLNDEEMQKYYFDSVAAILSFVQLYNNCYDIKYNTFPIFQILIDSPLFDPQLTIFTKNSENESVHKLRMIAYYLFIFQNEQNIQLFFTQKRNFPFMISEFFFYGLNYKKYKFTIPKEILDSQIFLDNIYQIILSYLNKGETNQMKKIPEDRKIDTNSFSSFDMKQIEHSITDVNSSDNNIINDNIPLQDSESQTDQDDENKSSTNLHSHFKTHSSLLLSNESDESQQNLTSEIFDVNSSFASLNSNSSQQISLNETTNESSPLKFQSIPKIHHRRPISNTKNNLLKWFDSIKNDDKRNININNEQEKYSLNDLIELTLVYSLVFISNIIENDDEIASLWNESTNLASLFFYLLFNEFIRPIILNILFHIWSSKKSSVTMYSQDFIANVFEQNYDDDYSLLDLQLLETINRYLYHKSNIIVRTIHSNIKNLVSINDKDFVQIIEPFMKIYQFITSILINCDISSDFLHNSMILFSFYTKTIKRKSRAAISSALLRIEGKNPDKKFYHDFILIITSFNNDDESTEFLITQPKMISVFIESFSESDFLNDIFEFIQSLCKNSVANTIACHNGNVDITLIKYILKHKESKFVSKALRLFNIIASTASSIPVVSQFISLFCPIKSHFSPPYILDCMQTFTRIIRSKQTHPTAYLPISKKSPYVEIFKMTRSKIYQGFTFTAKLFIDKFAQKSQSKLLQISDQNNNLTLTIIDNQVYICSNDYPVIFEDTVPLNKWFNIAVTFVPSNNKVECQIENQSVYRKDIVYPQFNSMKYLKCEVGNGSHFCLFMMHAALIGSFSFYPFSNSSADSPLFNFKNNQIVPWISVNFDIDRSLLKIVTKPNQPELNASLVGENLISNLSFADVLLKFFKAEILIPLFAQIGFPVYNSNDVSNQLKGTNFSISYTKWLHDLLLVTLKLSNEVQQSFAQSQGFRIIAYLLQNIVDPSILTLDFYMHFVFLFEDLTCQELSIQLLLNILMNAEIWSLATIPVIQEIVRYWNSFLNQEWFLYYCPFFKLILPISLFYQKMNDEINNKEKLKEIDTTRKLIRQFLCNVARIKFNEPDFNALFMTCIVGSNFIFSIDLLYLIQDIAKIENSPFDQFSLSERKYLFNSLDAILKYFDEDEVLLVIETILILHERKIIKNLKIDEHVEIMRMNLSKNMCTESFISKMIQLASKFSVDVLSIPFYLSLSSLSSYNSISESAFLSHQKSLYSIVKTLKPNRNYSNNFWFFWPLIFAIKNNEILDTMLDFIILSSLKNWMIIFISIYIICHCFNIDHLPIQRRFLVRLANHILQGNVKKDIESFVALTFYFIFSADGKKSVALKKLYNQSVFGTGNESANSVSEMNDNQLGFYVNLDKIKQGSGQSIVQRSNESINQRSNENINQSSNENINQRSNENINQRSNENINQRSNENINQRSNESINQRSNESINQSSNENINQRSNESINQSNNGNINQNNNESINQISNENINQSNNENINQNNSESINQISNESINQSSNENINQSSNENLNESNNQVTNNENINQSNNESIHQISNNENLTQNNNENINQSINENISQSSNENLNQSDNESINQSSKENLNQSSNENLTQSNNESIHQISNNENLTQNNNENINQGIKESISQSSNENLNQSDNESINQSSKENISQSINENLNQSSNENLTQSNNEINNQITNNEKMNQNLTQMINYIINKSSKESIYESSNDSIKQSSNDYLSSTSNISSEFDFNQYIEKTKIPFFDINSFMKKIDELSKAALNEADIITKFQFDVDENGNWRDEELCELFVHIFSKYESIKEVSQYLNFVQYLEARKQKKDKIVVCRMNLYEIYQSRIKFAFEIALNTKKISTYIVKSKERAQNSNYDIGTKINKVCEDSYQYLSIVTNLKKASNEKSRILWSDLWRNLTNDRSPWRNSLPLSETHFKRNTRILAYNCPVKLKQNLNFTNHKDASFNREYGSSEMAKEKLLNYLRELKEKNKKEAPPPLLSVSRNESSSLNYDTITINYDNQNVDFDSLKINQQSDYFFKHCYSSNYFSYRSSPQSIQTSLNDISHEKKMVKYDAKLLTLKGQKKIDFCISPSCLQIIFKQNEKGQNMPVKVKVIEASSISCILYRSYLHQEKSFEIVLESGKSYLINLKRGKSLDLLQKLKNESEFKSVFIQIDSPSEFISKMGYQEKWKNGLMSNFEYLMKLNFYGGRSFNETSIYPVFPWIIKDYSSTKIDLEDESIYRDMSTPIGALNEERLKDLKKHLLDYISFRNVAFLYNSCFISPLCVYLWLIRVEPFTSLHIDLQSGRFDYASRIFTSIPAAFNMVTNHMNDYRELIPEFFYTSSFLENRNHFDLGILRNKQVNDVVLPNWSKSAIDFIYTHRKALESDYINKHLNEWIDLIFGYCQKGEKAEEKNNTFDPCLYENIWSEENVNDETQRKMIKAVLKHCGHIPNQIFNEKHPCKEKFIVKPISDLESFKPSKEGNFPKSVFAFLFTVKPNDHHKSEYSTKKCIFVSNSGIISIASLTIKKDSKDTFYSIVSNPLIGPLIPTSKGPSKTRKLLEKVPSTPLSVNPYHINFSGNDSANAYRSASYGIVDPKNLRINLTIANMSEKSSIFAFSPNNSLLIVATNIGAIIVSQVLGESKKYGLLVKHVGRVNCVTISDNFIVSGGSDTSINIWSLSKEIQFEKVMHESNTTPFSQQSSLVSPSKPKNEAERKQSLEPESPQSFRIINDSISPIKHLKTIQSFRNEITCIDISEKFGTIASGTKDGSIILIDTENLESTVTIGMAPEVPIMVKITSGWGFVVVYSNKEHEGQIMSFISVFDIDGQLIRKKQINFEIDCWTQFTSIDGFDFMVFGSINSSTSCQNAKGQEGADNGNQDDISISSQNKFNLYMFEVFYIDIEEAGIKKSDSRFMELKYCVKKGVLYAVTENGTINIYPTTELNTQRFHRTIFGNDSQ